MMGLFKKAPPSKDVARDRLKMILVTDRMDSSTHVLEMMKNELLIVLQKYLHIYEDDFDLQICQQGHDGDSEPARLRADIPIKSMKRR